MNETIQTQLPEGFLELSESGELPVGLCRDSTYHCKYKLRPGLAIDMLAAGTNAWARQSTAHAQIYILGRQLKRLGSLPADEANHNVIVTLSQADLNALLEAQERLEKKVHSFREITDSPAEGGSPSGSEDGVVRV